MGQQIQTLGLFISLKNSFLIQQLYCFLPVLLMVSPVYGVKALECSDVIIFKSLDAETSWGRDPAWTDRYEDTIPTILPFNTSDLVNMTEGSPLLNLSNTGPAVLDSEVTFQAVLWNSPSEAMKMFLYQWQTNTTKPVWYTVSDYESKTTVKFERPVSPARYEMRVCVYHEKWTLLPQRLFKLVAQGEMDFTLTELLNGHLGFEQNLPYQKHKHVFEIGKPVTLYTELSDRFHHTLLYSNFYWYKDGTLFRRTTEPLTNVTFNVTMDTVANVVVVHTYSSISPSAVKLLGNSDDDYLEKMGSFTHKIYFKEPLSNMNVTGLNTVVVDSTLRLNVSFTGSAPVELCWRVHCMNCSIEYNHTCQQTLHSNVTWLVVPVTINSTGRFSVKVILKNDISIMKKHHFVYAYNPDFISSPGAILPVAFSLLGLMFIMVGILYVLRQQKKKPVEVAAYDFLPTLTAGHSHPLIDALKLNLQKLFHQEHKPEYSLSSDRLYGSMSDTESIYSEIM